MITRYGHSMFKEHFRCLSHTGSDYWPLLQHPPRGTEISIVRAENCDQWDSHVIQRLEMLANKERDGSEGKFSLHVFPKQGSGCTWIIQRGCWISLLQELLPWVEPGTKKNFWHVLSNFFAYPSVCRLIRGVLNYRTLEPLLSIATSPILRDSYF